MSEKNKTIEIKEEELEKVTGGNGGLFQALRLIVGESHIVYDNEGGYKKITITGIDGDVYRVHQEIFTGDSTCDTWFEWNLNSLQNFWNQ